VNGENVPLTINCFGAYRNTAGDFIWSGLGAPNNKWTNYNSPNSTWQVFGNGANEDFPYIVGGDLNGNVYFMFEFFQAPTSDNDTNFNFSVTTKRFNPYFELGLKCKLAYIDLYITALPYGEITVNHFIDDQQEAVITKTVELYSRGVVDIQSITPGNPTLITTVDDHNLQTNQLATLDNIVGSIGNTLNNQTFVSTVIDNLNFTIPLDTTNLIYTSNGFLYNQDLSEDFPTGDTQYTRVYLGASAHMHQLQFTLSDAQLADPVKGTAQFELQGFVIWTKPMGRIRG
jgi:hypothetical protein